MTRLIDADELKTIKSIQSADFNSIESIQRWIDNAPTVTPDMAQVLAYESGKSSERKKTYKDLCDTCKRGDVCELSTKKILFCSCRTTQCSQYKRRSKNGTN